MFDDEEYYREHEPPTLPDFFIPDDAVCGVCKQPNDIKHPLEWVCSECGAATHTECGADCEPSGGWDRNYDVNYWVCNTCMDKANSELEAMEDTGPSLVACPHCGQMHEAGLIDQCPLRHK